MPGFQTKAPPPNCMVGWASVLRQSWIFLFAKEDRFLMLFQTCNKLTFGPSDILVITVIPRNRINIVGSFYCCLVWMIIYILSIYKEGSARPYIKRADQDRCEQSNGPLSKLKQKRPTALGYSLNSEQSCHSEFLLVCFCLKKSKHISLRLTLWAGFPLSVFL